MNITQGWLLFRYEPVSLFSLRTTHSTNKGGKTLLVPTPYAVKLALIDACFRRYGSEQTARSVFDLIKERRIQFKPPRDCIVQNTFVKIRQEERNAPSGIYTSTIAYREWVYYKGQMIMAMQAEKLNIDEKLLLRNLASHINYFGKRGSFWQFIESDELEGDLPEGFTVSGDSENLKPELYGVSHFLDDFGEALCSAPNGFERISTYHTEKIRLGEHRVLIPTLVPYVRRQTTRNFTRYLCEAHELF